MPMRDSEETHDARLVLTEVTLLTPGAEPVAPLRASAASASWLRPHGGAAAIPTPGLALPGRW